MINLAGCRSADPANIPCSTNGACGGAAGVMMGGGGAGGAGAGSVAGCGATPAFGCPCTISGMLACNGAHQKLRLVCTTLSGRSGQAWQMLDTCPSTGDGFNCDNRDASCQPIIPSCVRQIPGFAYCETGTNSAYTDVRKTCGPDLVTNDTNMTCDGVCAAGACQAAACGDKKLETGEACDDGNTKPRS